MSGKEIKIKLSKQAIKKYDLDSNAQLVEIESPNGIKLVPKRLDLEKIYLELTTDCNFDCITCIRNSWYDEIGKMSDQILDKFLAEIKTLPNLKTVHLGGFGEPQMHPRFMEVIEVAKANDLEVEFITNGHFLTSETIDRLLDLAVDKIITSVDAPEAESFEKIRLNADFDQVLSNLEYLNQQKKKRGLNKPQLLFEFVVMQDNYHLLPNLTKLAEQLGVESILVTNLLPYTEDMIDQTIYDQDKKEFELGSQGSFLYLKTQFPEMELKTERECAFVSDKSLSINWQGHITPCYPLLHSYQVYVYGRKKEITAYHLGNLAEESLVEIWTKAEYIKFRDQVEFENLPSCPDCKFIEGCGMTIDNQLDCWGNSPTCADCLWYRGIILCP